MPQPELRQHAVLSSEGLNSRSLRGARQVPFYNLIPKQAPLLAGSIYLACHAYTIPLFEAGPSWVIWPKLDDFATILLALTVWVFSPRTHLTSHWRAFERSLLWANLFTFASFIFLVVLGGGGEREVNTGLFQSLRVAQYSIVFVCFVRIGQGARFVRPMLRVVLAVWAFIFVVSLSCFLGWLRPVTLASHLLGDPASAGAWGKLLFAPAGLLQGPLGYSNTYMGCQMTLLGVLLAFGRRRSTVMRSIVLLLTFIVVFLSGARAALVGFLCASALAALTAKWRILLIVGATLGLPLLYAVAPPRWVDLADSTVRRQEGLTTIGQESSFAERVVIWGDKLYYIKENPSVLILGLGWGRMGETGANAHMLPLQILMETGVIGLAFFFFLMRSLLRALWNSGEIGQSLALATLGLLVTSAAQEVFYPIPSMGSFLGVFLALCGLAAAARLDPSTHRGGVQ